MKSSVESTNVHAVRYADIHERHVVLSLGEYQPVVMIASELQVVVHEGISLTA